MEQNKFEKFYENGNLIAVLDNETGDILPKGKNGDKDPKWESRKKSVEKILNQREKILKLIQNKEIDAEEIEKIDIIDLKYPIKTLEQEKIKKFKEENKLKENESIVKKQDKNKNLKTDKNQIFTEKEVNKIAPSSSNEIKTSVSTDYYGGTLGKELGLEEYDSILLVYSSNLNKISDKNVERADTILSPIGKKKDGTYEVIPPEKLTPYRGGNRDVIEISDESNEVTENHEQTMFISSTGSKLAINQNNSHGESNAYLVRPTHNNDGNVGQKLQDKYDGTDRTDVKLRTLYDRNKGEYQIDKMQDEYEGHKQVDCNEQIDLDEVDGDLATGHTHLEPITANSILLYNGQEMIVEDIANLPRFKMSTNEFIEKYNNYAKKTGEKNVNSDEIYNDIEQDANEEVRGNISRDI